MLVELNLGGNFTSGIGSAERGLTNFGSVAATATPRTGLLSGAFGAASSASGKFGGALSHAKMQIGNLLSGPLGLIGLTGGLFALGGLLKEGVGKAQSFGDEVRQMAAVSGLSAESTSALAAAMEHFNVPADRAIRLTGFLEKNVGLLASRKDGIAAFQKTFNLALTDANGHLKDANELILTTADYFNNKSIPATEKAAALSKLYGRSWQDLIPFLKAGRQGIKDAEDEAARLGLVLTKDNVDALAKMKMATRDLGTAMGGLELQIGLALVPALTDLAKAATSFVSEHRADIVAFFKGAVEWGKNAIGIIGQVAGTLGSAWNAIPGPLRDFLTKGLVADRTIKFLFGFSPVESLLKGLTGQLFSRGSSPINPMWVQQVGGALGGGGAPSVVGGGGGSIIGALGIAGLVVAAALVVGPEVRKWAIANGLAGSGPTAGMSQVQEIRFRQDAKTPKIIVEMPRDANAREDRGWTQSEKNHLYKALQQETAREQARKLSADQTAALQRIRERAESNALTTKSAINDVRDESARAKIAAAGSAQTIRNATTSGTSRIVGAIARNRPTVNVSVRVSGMNVTVQKTYSQGDMGKGDRPGWQGTGGQ